MVPRHLVEGQIEVEFSEPQVLFHPRWHIFAVIGDVTGIVVCPSRVDRLAKTLFCDGWGEKPWTRSFLHSILGDAHGAHLLDGCWSGTSFVLDGNNPIDHLHGAGEPTDITISVLHCKVVRVLDFFGPVVVRMVRNALVFREIEPEDDGEAEQEHGEEAADLSDVFVPRCFQFRLLLDSDHSQEAGVAP